MSRDSLLSRKLPFSSAAVLAAAATGPGGEFRPRDMRFFLELFSNWVSINFPDGFIQVQNTQIVRFLDNSYAQGLLQRRSGTARSVTYRITRSGVPELASMLMHDDGQGRRERFFFVVYFLSNYASIIMDMVKSDKKRYPYLLTIELERLLNPLSVIDREIDRTRQEIKELEVRISMAVESACIFESEIAAGTPVEEAVRKFQNRFPYTMNNAKPLGDLIKTLPEALQTTELGEGSRKRAALIWEPHRNMLCLYLKELEGLKARACAQ